MHIKILGSGCPKCVQLEKNTKEALKHFQTPYTIEKVTQMKDIVSYGVLSTPALVVDETILSYGKVLTPNEIINILKK
jgi:small redox-active disulfide protein 2